MCGRDVGENIPILPQEKGNEGVVRDHWKVSNFFRARPPSFIKEVRKPIYKGLYKGNAEVETNAIFRIVVGSHPHTRGLKKDFFRFYSAVFRHTPIHGD